MNLSRAFETDFGFELNDSDMPETVVKDSPVMIADLVDGFSWSNSYASAVVSIAKKEGIKSATTMVVFFNFEYRPEQAKPNKAALIKFLAAVRFS